MVLNSNFSPIAESVIIWNPELTNWFVRNQEWLAYFELTHVGGLHFENSSASNDIRILGRMANAAYEYIELDDEIVSEYERADLATQAMASIYEQNKELLTDTAKELYVIRSNAEKSVTEECQNNEYKPFTKVLLPKHNGTKNRRPGKGHRNH